MRDWIPRCVIAVFAAVVVAACGSPADRDAPGSAPGAGASSTASPDSPVTSGPGSPVTSGPGSGGGAGGATEISPSEGLVEVRPQPWDKVEALPGDEELDVYFYGGVKACYGLDRYQVMYGEHEIVVTLFAGRKPDAEVCIEVAKRFVTRVELSEPVAGRKIVDGSGR
jgi:hypothetical protein